MSQKLEVECHLVVFAVWGAGEVASCSRLMVQFLWLSSVPKEVPAPSKARGPHIEPQHRVPMVRVWAAKKQQQQQHRHVSTSKNPAIWKKSCLREMAADLSSLVVVIRIAIVVSTFAKVMHVLHAGLKLTK